MNTVVLQRSCRKRLLKMPSFRQVFLGLVVMLAMLIVGLIVYPIILTLISTFVQGGALTAAPFEKAVQARGFGTILYNTAIYTAGSLFLSCAIGMFLAWANERTDARIDSLAGILPILPLMVPPIGSALGYVMLFANNSGIGNITLRYIFGIETGGPISILNFYGLIAVSSLSLAPVVYLIVSAALRNLDPALDEAARVFGASPRRTLLKITLPVVGPAIASAALLVAIHAVSSFTFPFIIGTSAGITTLSVHIYRLFAIFPPDSQSAVAVSVALLLFVYLGLYFQLRVARAVGRAVVAGKSSSSSVVKLGPWRYLVRAFFVIYLAAVILPVVGLVIGSLQPYLGAAPSQFSLDNFRTVLANFETRHALINSFSLGALAATINMVVAGVLMFASMRMLKKSGPLIEYSLMVPAVIPHIVLAVALIVAFSGPPFYLYGTKLLVLIAYCVMFVPEASRAASSAVSQASEELSEAAHVAGAGLFRTLTKVVLPQVVNGLLAGWVIVFFLAVNEVTASSFLGGLNSAVVGHVAIDYFANGRLSEVAAMTLIVTLVTATVVFAASGIIGRAYVARR